MFHDLTGLASNFLTFSHLNITLVFTLQIQSCYKIESDEQHCEKILYNI